MIIAVIAVRMMQMAVREVIDVVAVRNGVVAAVGTVFVALVMAVATVGRGALGRVGRADGEGVLLDLLAFDVMQMAVVQVIDVAIVNDRRVAASGAVLVRMVFVNMGHGQSPCCDIAML